MVYPPNVTYVKKSVLTIRASFKYERSIWARITLRQLLDLMHNMRKTNNFHCNILLTRWLIIGHSTKRMSSLETARVHASAKRV